MGSTRGHERSNISHKEVRSPNAKPCESCSATDDLFRVMIGFWHPESRRGLFMRLRIRFDGSESCRIGVILGIQAVFEEQGFAPEAAETYCLDL